MAIKVDILSPINDGGANFNPALFVSSIQGGLTYDVAGYSAIVSQLENPIDAAWAGTITLQCSLDGQTFFNFPTAITYTANGVNQSVNVEGLRFVRYQVTTTSGTVEFRATVSGVKIV